MPQDSEFDTYAGNYDEALAKGISVSGESKDYFAEGRVDWLAKRLRPLGVKPATVLDFGCGTGASAPFLFDILRAEKYIGLDTSAESIKVAREVHGSPRADFIAGENLPAGQNVDLAFCNGVFHHIPPAVRLAALKTIFESLKPGGIFAFWENNPWNPGTKYVMSRIPFDRDAITIPAPEAKAMLRAVGFDILHLDFLFIFPRILGWFRRFEPGLSRLPLGAQYMVLAAKPRTK